MQRRRDRVQGVYAASPEAGGVSPMSRECASILATRPEGAPGRDKPVPASPQSGMGTLAVNSSAYTRWVTYRLALE